MSDQFKLFFKKQIYRPVFNWRGIETAIDIPVGRIKEVVYGEQSFSEEEISKLFAFFNQMAKESINIPIFTA